MFLSDTFWFSHTIYRYFYPRLQIVMDYCCNWVCWSVCLFILIHFIVLKDIYNFISKWALYRLIGFTILINIEGYCQYLIQMWFALPYSIWRAIVGGGHIRHVTLPWYWTRWGLSSVGTRLSVRASGRLPCQCPSAHEEMQVCFLTRIIVDIICLGWVGEGPSCFKGWQLWINFCPDI